MRGKNRGPNRASIARGLTICQSEWRHALPVCDAGVVGQAGVGRIDGERLEEIFGIARQARRDWAGEH